MKSLDRTALIVALALVTGAFACGGSSAPERGDDSAASELNPDDGAQVCEANPPPNARCAVACPNGYKGASGTFTCECCTDEPAPVCEANPPPNARCAAACPFGYKGPSGTYTCECCTGTDADAGSAIEPDEVCGPPPPNARCMACPAGSSGYKQIDGQPTCECCSS